MFTEKIHRPGGMTSNPSSASSFSPPKNSAHFAKNSAHSDSSSPVDRDGMHRRNLDLRRLDRIAHSTSIRHDITP